MNLNIGDRKFWLECFVIFSIIWGFAIAVVFLMIGASILLALGLQALGVNSLP